MKITSLHIQLRLVTWYIGIIVLGFFAIESSCSCRNNDINDRIPPTAVSLKFEKLSHDRGSKRLVVIIKNIGKEIAKDLSLQCTNISQEEASRMAVLFNNTITTTTIPIPDLAAGASTQEIHIPIDFQAAKEALAQVEIISGQQIATTATIQINRYPINMLPKEAIFIISKQGETSECKWKLAIDPQEQPIDFTKFRLMVWKSEDVIVSIEGISTVLDQSTNFKVLTGAELEKLAKQQEVVVRVKNQRPDDLNFINFALVGSSGEEIYQNVIKLIPEIKRALLPAATAGNIDFVKQAIKDGADLNGAKNTYGQTALHLATEYDHQEIVQLFLNNGADVNAKDNDGNTALHVAAKLGRKTIVETILTHGFDKSIKNNNNETVADVAKDQEIKDLINNWKN